MPRVAITPTVYTNSPLNRAALPASLHVTLGVYGAESYLQVTYNSIPFPIKFYLELDETDTVIGFTIESLEKKLSTRIGDGRLRCLTNAFFDIVTGGVGHFSCDPAFFTETNWLILMAMYSGEAEEIAFPAGNAMHMHFIWTDSSLFSPA